MFINTAVQIEELSQALSALHFLQTGFRTGAVFRYVIRYLVSQCEHPQPERHGGTAGSRKSIAANPLGTNGRRSLASRVFLARRLRRCRPRLFLRALQRALQVLRQDANSWPVIFGFRADDLRLFPRKRCRTPRPIASPFAPHAQSSIVLTDSS